MNVPGQKKSVNAGINFAFNYIINASDTLIVLEKINE